MVRIGSETKTLQVFKKRYGSKPTQGSEHDNQVALFEWATWKSKEIPELDLMFAIPNGAFYGGKWSTAVKMKAEGVKKGVPDIFLPAPMMYHDINTGNLTEMYAGLFIELKVGRNKPSPEQLEYMDKLRGAGYMAVICYGFDEAKDCILDYLDAKV
jgi:hypothetical protein